MTPTVSMAQEKDYQEVLRRLTTISGQIASLKTDMANRLTVSAFEAYRDVELKPRLIQHDNHHKVYIGFKTWCTRTTWLIIGSILTGGISPHAAGLWHHIQKLIELISTSI